MLLRPADRTPDTVFMIADRRSGCRWNAPGLLRRGLQAVLEKTSLLQKVALRELGASMAAILLSVTQRSAPPVAVLADTASNSNLPL